MRMHFLRNATFVLHSGDDQILVDPMLGPPNSLMSLTWVRRPHRNPRRATARISSAAASRSYPCAPECATNFLVARSGRSRRNMATIGSIG